MHEVSFDTVPRAIAMAVVALAVVSPLVAREARAQAPAPPATPATTPATPPAPAPSRPLADSLKGPAFDAYQSAKLLFANGDYQGSLTKFEQAYDLSKDPRLLFNVAICDKNVRRYAATQRMLRKYVQEMGTRIAPADQAAVDAALAAIQGLVGTVKLSVSEQGASVAVDGEAAGTTPLADPLAVDLGKHTLTVKKDGFVTSEQPFEVAGGNELAVTVTLAPEVHVARLLVRTEDDATVSIDGQPTTGGHFDGRLAPGPHAVLVTASGKLPYKADVDLRDGETRSLDVTLDSESHGQVWPWIVGGAAVVAVGAVIGGYFLFKPQDTTAPVPPGKFGSVTFSVFGR
jgi:hypothetical protein